MKGIILKIFRLNIINKKQKKLISKLIQNGYSYNGFGVDHNNIDWLFKKKSKWNDLFQEYFHLHKFNYKRLNKIIKKYEILNFLFNFKSRSEDLIKKLSYTQ